MNDWLNETRNLTSGDRQRDYGHPLPNMLRIALKWSVTLEYLVRPLDVARMMVDMKMARDQQTFKEDNWIDTMGYARVVELMIERLGELGYEEPLVALREVSFAGMWDMLQDNDDFEFDQEGDSPDLEEPEEVIEARDGLEELLYNLHNLV